MSISNLFLPNETDLFCDEFTCNILNATEMNITTINATTINATDVNATNVNATDVITTRVTATEVTADTIFIPAGVPLIRQNTLVASFTGPFAATNAVIDTTRISNVVTMRVGLLSQPFAAAMVATTLDAIPIEYRPVTATVFSLIPAINAGVPVIGVGSISVGGIVSIGLNGSGALPANYPITYTQTPYISGTVGWNDFYITYLV